MSAIGAALSRPLVALAPSRRLRRRLALTVAAAGVLAAGYMLWFRDSWLVKVEQVTVSGVTTRDAGHVREALAAAARSMTTLHLDRDRLEQAVAGYPVVRGVRATPDFPGSLRIEVVEHRPAALAIAGGTRVPVAADGTVLRGLPVEGRLPELRLRGALPPKRLREPPALRAARVLGGAAEPLRRRLLEVGAGDKGLTVRMRAGPLLIFGDAGRLHAKWIAAARVLADPAASGAGYIDLRLPGRPAVGGLEGQALRPAAPPAAQTAPGAASANPQP